MVQVLCTESDNDVLDITNLPLPALENIHHFWFDDNKPEWLSTEDPQVYFNRVKLYCERGMPLKLVSIKLRNFMPQQSSWCSQQRFFSLMYRIFRSSLVLYDDFNKASLLARDLILQNRMTVDFDNQNDGVDILSSELLSKLDKVLSLITEVSAIKDFSLNIVLSCSQMHQMSQHSDQLSQLSALPFRVTLAIKAYEKAEIATAEDGIPRIFLRQTVRQCNLQYLRDRILATQSQDESVKGESNLILRYSILLLVSLGGQNLNQINTAGRVIFDSRGASFNPGELDKIDVTVHSIVVDAFLLSPVQLQQSLSLLLSSLQQFTKNRRDVVYRFSISEGVYGNLDYSGAFWNAISTVDPMMNVQILEGSYSWQIHGARILGLYRRNLQLYGYMNFDVTQHARPLDSVTELSNIISSAVGRLQSQLLLQDYAVIVNPDKLSTGEIKGFLYHIGKLPVTRLQIVIQAWSQFDWLLHVDWSSSIRMLEEKKAFSHLEMVSFTWHGLNPGDQLRYLLKGDPEMVAADFAGSIVRSKFISIQDNNADGNQGWIYVFYSRLNRWIRQFR
ncbi:hypothetical protein MIR68_011299 [Amoeboaphelidium protococcarum]|nr:hypothetical protein MIR68_011299 [Amoeboaphelidium protococcarum]